MIMSATNNSDISDVELLEFLAGYGSNGQANPGMASGTEHSKSQYQEPIQYHYLSQSHPQTPCSPTQMDGISSGVTESPKRRNSEMSEADSNNSLILERWEPGEIIEEDHKEDAKQPVEVNY